MVVLYTNRTADVSVADMTDALTSPSSSINDLSQSQCGILGVIISHSIRSNENVPALLVIGVNPSLCNITVLSGNGNQYILLHLYFLHHLCSLAPKHQSHIFIISKSSLVRLFKDFISL
jgi:hypothetical protein